MNKTIFIITAVILSVALIASVTYNFDLNNKVAQLEETIGGSTGQSLDDFIPANPIIKGTKEAYIFARANLEVMKKINCYCGCQSSAYGHKSLADCFVKKINDKSVIEYSDHGRNCQKCILEALDTKKWLAEGHTYEQIGKLIDAKYK